ncbi:MAG: dephospho-CoA kinase [Dehalococcoidales bacterium]|jgi:dephospho-CoA kinase|nr:dephospho-CoA kinase [Dehalococcoidales bacterium]MDD4465356.1 dephospho-CoA kinase [Dehalococcoidales bacterium]
MAKMMKIIGLTGGIGSGKSTVAAILADLGAQVINADVIGHRILEENQAVRNRLVKRFGTGIIQANGTVNREELAKRVFISRYETRFLNRLLHPLIRSHIEEVIKSLPKAKDKPFVIEAPLLIEAGWQNLVDAIWVTEAPLETRLARLEERGLPREKALKRIKEQIDDRERRKFAHIVINTNTDLSDLKIVVTQIFEQIYG